MTPPPTSSDLAPPPAIGVGAALEDWTGDARYFEYTQAADPIGAGFTPPVPIHEFTAASRTDPTGTRALDLAAELGVVTGAATSPGLLASFLTVRAGDQVQTTALATSELYCVLWGAGTTTSDHGSIAWTEGDVFVLPAGTAATHIASQDASIYWVTDEPLLRYLGVAPAGPRFRPTHFTGARNRAELEAVAQAPGAASRNRISVLLANAEQTQTLTATPVLWAMYGRLPVGAVQRPHRHQSVALDLIIDCQPGCYTLVGADVDDHGQIVDPVRVDWEPAGAFVTPPGMWHAHFNESDRPAHLFPVQDAGLQTYLRSLDITFVGQR